MKAYQIFQESSDNLGTSIFQYLRNEQKDVYTASLSSLAQNRRLRPVFIQRKPGKDQIAWILKNISLKGSNEIAEHVLQLWLMKAHQNLLVEFLDGLGIEHDGEGAADDLPDDLDAKKLKTTVDKMLADHDKEVVRTYLHVFNLQSEGGFDSLNALIVETPDLHLGEAPVVAAAAPEPVAEEPTAPAEEEAPEVAAEAEPEAEAEAPAKKKSATKKKSAAKKAAKSDEDA